jgi:hypothetical protein
MQLYMDNTSFNPTTPLVSDNLVFFGTPRSVQVGGLAAWLRAAGPRCIPISNKYVQIDDINNTYCRKYVQSE